ncbi:MAG TPA: serine hydrolase domain-containing protein [Caulobacteraceae bacterium]|jgi:CubicO group peptidase (beta-lactamase class C family)|nr:serine hydrolase domain-containing protein [Caulobacteraceae bacterium]
MPTDADIATMDLRPFIDAGREEVRAIMARNQTLGTAAVLVRGDEVVWSECFGVTDAASNRPIDPHTLFSLQSTSKNVTAAAVMMAVQRGLLDLDRPITDYLPDFTVNSRHEQDPQRRMTLRLLLSHRAGFTHEAPVGGNFRPDSRSFEAHVDSISRTWLRYPVGARYAYSNLGIDLAGLVLAKAFGAPFDETLKALIFDPLGMGDTTATPEVYVARENRAIGHAPDYDRVPVVVPMQAAGGVYSSAADMARYAAFHLGKGRLGGQTLLEPRLWEAMHAFPETGYQYGLGVMRLPLDLEHAGIDLLAHNGGGFGFGSSFFYCPDQGLAWVLLYNGQSRGAPSNPYDEIILHPILKHAHGPVRPPRPPAAQPVAPTPEALDRLAGTYVTGISFMTLRREGDGLVLTASDDPAPNRLVFTGPDTAWMAEGPGAPKGLRFHPGRGLEAPWLEFDNGVGFDYNDGERDAPGPIGRQYHHDLGDYIVNQWGRAIYPASLYKKNGWLYLSGLRVTEHQPGLLFTGDGEALDLRGEAPEFRNIPLERTPPIQSESAP